jgi:carbon-monoxide dehydrogenase large subunit
MPYKTALTFTYDSGEFAKGMDMALEMANYAGSVTQGQGHETVFKQIVCDRLGLKPEQVHYIWGDTDMVPFGHGTGGSRSSALGGSAVHVATGRVIDKAKRIAAHMLETAVEDIDVAEGVFRVAGTDRSVTIGQVARAAVDPTKLPAGIEPGLMATAVFEVKVANYPNGCHVCELEIDPETGVVEVVNYNVVDDVGTVMNPLLLKGQIHGGIAQGLGQVLMETIAYDADGQLVTGSFMDYAMPHADNFCPIEVKANPVPTKTNPLGVKGAGEAGTVGAMPAVTNAIIDALSPLGIRNLDIPLTPEKLWQAIRSADGG